MQNNPYSTPQSDVDDIERFDSGIVEEPLEEIKRPWLSIWTRPRATIRYLVAAQPTRYVLLLALISGLYQNLNGMNEQYLAQGFETWHLVVIAVLGAPITGWLGLYLSAAVLRWTGSWLDGRANVVSLRCAVAWAGIPAIPLLLCVIAQLVLLGDESFLSSPASLNESTSLWTINAGIDLIKLALTLWWTVILIKSIAQVQGFSAWRSLGNGLLSVVVMLFGFVALAVVITIPFIFLQALLQ